MIVIASYYALFAVMEASTHALVLESLVGAVFLALAVSGFRSSLWAVVAAQERAHSCCNLTTRHQASPPCSLARLRRIGVLYMVVERYRAGAAEAIYQRLQARGRQMPSGLHYVESWVDLKCSTCYQLMRTDDPDLFRIWTDAWSDLVEFEITPVVTSAEAADAVARQRETQSLRD